MTTTTTANKEVHFTIQPTPNPNALKFILNHTVKTKGSANYKTPMECKEVPLALALFTIRGIDQIHFHENTITINKFGYEDWDTVEPQVVDCLKDKLPAHDPDYQEEDPEALRRESLSPELQQIEAIIDRTIRPGLQGDGGDLRTISYDVDDHVLIIKFQGACGTCPSSTTGTLEAIKAILRDEFDPEINVYLAPEM